MLTSSPLASSAKIYDPSNEVPVVVSRHPLPLGAGLKEGTAHHSAVCHAAKWIVFRSGRSHPGFETHYCDGADLQENRLPHMPSEARDFNVAFIHSEPDIVLPLETDGSHQILVEVPFRRIVGSALLGKYEGYRIKAEPVAFENICWHVTSLQHAALVGVCDTNFHPAEGIGASTFVERNGY